MAQPFRKKFFYTLFAIFCVAGTIAIFYSQGYIFDLSSFSVTKGGAVYIEGIPNDFEIFLNDKPYKNKSSIIQKGTLISNLVPKKYHLVLKKDGYFDYEKNINLSPSSAERVINTILIKKDMQPKETGYDVKGMDIQDQSNDGRIITLDKEKVTYYLYRLENPDISINLTKKIPSFFKKKIDNIKLHPSEKDKLLVQSKNDLYIIDLDKEKYSLINEKTTAFFQAEKNNLFIFSKEVEAQIKNVKKTSTTTPSVPKYNLQIFDLGLNTKINTTEIKFDPSLIKSVDISDNGKYTSINLSNGSLLLYGQNGKDFYEVAQKSKISIFSPDSKKLFYQDTDGKSFVYLIEDEIVGLDSEKGAKIKINLVNASKIEGVWWLNDSFHLILKYQNKITLAEITKKEPNNHFTIFEGLGSSFYNNQKNTIFILKDSKIQEVNLNE